MKFRDTLRLSFHNMWNNKMMTLLVTIVLLILSLLVSTIIAFSIDMTEVSNKLLSNSEDALDIRMQKMSSRDRGSFSESDIDKFRQIYKDNHKYFTSMVYSANGNETFVEIGDHNFIQLAFVELDSDLMTGTKNTVNAGRLWNSEDKDKNNIWIEKSYAMNNGYAIGDKVTLNVGKRNHHGGEDEFATYDFNVAGILDITSRYGQNYEAYVGVNCLKKFGMGVTEIKMASSPIFKANVGDLLAVKKICDANNTYDYKTNPNGISVYSSKVSGAMSTLIMSVVIIGASIFFSLIIILLSIGCISNAIQITVEQNRKFFGMMKAVGLRNKTVKSIVRWQAVIMILVAVIIASCITIGILAGVKPMIFEALQVGENVDIPFSLPFYVPFIVFAMQVLLVILFTNKSLNKISKMDVISVISEVN